MLKKLGRFVASMRLALLLLGLIVVACVIGGVIPQGAQPAQYQALYGEGVAGVLQALQLHRVFTAWWFVALVALLLVNLCLCSLLRFPAVLKAYRAGYSLEKLLARGNPVFTYQATPKQAQRFFRRMGFAYTDPVTREDGTWRYAVRRKAGLWGSWLSHLGMLVIVVGFALGQMLHFETSVYGVPGQRLPVPGTQLEVGIDNFDIILRPDNTVEQYIADLTIYNVEDGTQHTGRSMVNAPLQAYGKSFLQNSTGWAATLATYQGDEQVDSRVLFAGESLELTTLNADYTDLALVFHTLYPDYIQGPGGPRTRSPHLNNPAALFSLFYQGKLVDMNVAGMGYDIKAADWRFVLSDPQPYTLIQVVSDPTLPIVAAGGALMLIGLFLAFYLRPEELWLKQEGEQVTIWGHTAKGEALFSDKAAIIIKEVLTQP